MERKLGTIDWTMRYPPRPSDERRCIPGSSVKTGAHSTNPEPRTSSCMTVRATTEWAARLTAPTVRGPTVDDGTGCPEDQERREGEGQQQPLEHERKEQPMAGQVTQGPGQGGGE